MNLDGKKIVCHKSKYRIDTSVSCIVFFFQAEDGIRDYKVTGVQTCALPISSPTSQHVNPVALGRIAPHESVKPTLATTWYISEPGVSLKSPSRIAGVSPPTDRKSVV